MTKPKSEIIKRPVEQMGSNIKKTAWSSCFESLATLAIGVLFIMWPDSMMKAVAYLIGAILIVKGGLSIFTYFMDEKNVYTNLLLSGVVSTLIGIAALIAGPNIADVFRIVIGIFLIYEALVRLSSAVKLYHAKINLWKFMVVLALIILVLGIVAIATSTAAIIGWVMVISGVIGIVGDIMFIQQVDKVISALTGAIDNLGKTRK